VHKRLYNAMKQEFKLLAEIISLEGGDYPYNVTNNQQGLKQSDFDGRIDIVPVANPNIFSMSQRVSLAQEQLKLAMAQPQLHNQYEAYRRVYTALGVDNIEQILPPPQQPTPMGPAQENGILQLALSGRQQIQAFPQQDHDAHIQAHLAYMSSMVVRGNPAALQLLQTHIFEHIGMKAKMVHDQQMMQDPNAQQQPPEMHEAMVAQIETQLITEYLQQEQQVLGGGQQDPLVDLKQQELQLRQQEQMQQAQQDQMELEFNRQKANEQAAIARERIESTEDIAAMRAQIAMQRSMNRGG